MIVTDRERERDIGRGRSRLHAPGAGRGTRSRVSRITPRASGGAKQLCHQGCPTTCILKKTFLALSGDWIVKEQE